MMADVWVHGWASTAFAKHPDRDFRSLADEALDGLDLEGVDGAWFGNCAMGVWGQGNIRGQTVLRGLVAEGVPIVNVEGGCATGSAALQGAFAAIASGGASKALAVGVEKTWVPHDPMKSFALFLDGIDQRHPSEWQAFHAAEAERLGLAWAPHPKRILFLDLHALRAEAHMQAHGTTARMLAAVASKNHAHGAENPLAQYRFSVSIEEVLADKPVIGPLTRAMCAPISDGAAAVLLGAEPPVDGPRIRVRACSMAGGSWRALDEPGVTHAAGVRAFRQAGVSPADIALVEVHDATAFCELEALEALGFFAPGDAGPAALEGVTSAGGALPVNLSGGLESKGHPLGATGLGMVAELCSRLQPGQLGLAQNAGGVIGIDEALAGVTILEAAI